MPITTTYSSARNQLAKLLNEVTDNQEVVINELPRSKLRGIKTF